MKKATRILVGLKTQDHALELTDLACRIGAKKASLLLVHLLEVPAATPLDAPLPDLEAKGRRILRTGERVARRSRMKVQSQLLRSRLAGQALADVIKDEKIDLAVFGYHHDRTIGELILGTSAHYLMKHGPCKLVFQIPPHKRKAK